MWIYDGEDWIEEGANEREKKTDRSPLPEQEWPELEIVEVPQTTHNPPPPMP